MTVLRVDALPSGWLGKNHALHLAASQPEAREAEWLLFPPMVGEAFQRLSGKPLDLAYAFWPLCGPIVALGLKWAFWDALRGVNHWRGRNVKVGG